MGGAGRQQTTSKYASLLWNFLIREITEYELHISSDVRRNDDGDGEEERNGDDNIHMYELQINDIFYASKRRYSTQIIE